MGAERRPLSLYRRHPPRVSSAPAAYFQAVRNTADPVLAYAPSPGMPELVSAVQAYYRGLGVSYEPGHILITASGSEALTFLMLCILDEGDEVLIPEPFYPNYNTFVRAAGGVIRPIPTTPAEGYRFADRARLEALITDRTRAILFSDPGNPTGAVLTAEERRTLADVALEHGLYLVADEVYREFTYGGQGRATMAALEDLSDHLVLIDSVSKRFSACGARVGCLISKNQRLMAEALKLCQARLSVATLDQQAAAALYRTAPGYFDAVRQEYRSRRDTVLRKLRAIPGVICADPQGAFYVMAALPIRDADHFQQWLLTDFSGQGETVMFAPGGPFYATPGRGRNEIRIAYVLKPAALERAMELLALGLKAYQELEPFEPTA